jgi:hypothetical protein
MGFSERQDDMMNDDERERRIIEFLALEWRGLVVRFELPDGSAELYFPQPDHPDVLAFRAAKTLQSRAVERPRELQCDLCMGFVAGEPYEPYLEDL